MSEGNKADAVGSGGAMMPPDGKTDGRESTKELTAPPRGSPVGRALTMELTIPPMSEGRIDGNGKAEIIDSTTPIGSILAEGNDPRMLLTSPTREFRPSGSAGTTEGTGSTSLMMVFNPTMICETRALGAGSLKIGAATAEDSATGVAEALTGAGSDPISGSSAAETAAGIAPRMLDGSKLRESKGASDGSRLGAASDADGISDTGSATEGASDGKATLGSATEGTSDGRATLGRAIDDIKPLTPPTIDDRMSLGVEIKGAASLGTATVGRATLGKVSDGSRSARDATTGATSLGSAIDGSAKLGSDRLGSSTETKRLLGMTSEMMAPRLRPPDDGCAASTALALGRGAASDDGNDGGGIAEDGAATTTGTSTDGSTAGAGASEDGATGAGASEEGAAGAGTSDDGAASCTCGCGSACGRTLGRVTAAIDTAGTSETGMLTG
jgi:hypothetical protein